MTSVLTLATCNLEKMHFWYQPLDMGQKGTIHAKKPNDSHFEHSLNYRVDDLCTNVRKQVFLHSLWRRPNPMLPFIQ